MCDSQQPVPLVGWLWQPAAAPTLIGLDDWTANKGSAAFMASWPTDSPTLQKMAGALWACTLQRSSVTNAIGYTDSSGTATSVAATGSTAEEIIAQCVSLQSQGMKVMFINGQAIADLNTGHVPANNATDGSIQVPCCPEPPAIQNGCGMCTVPVSSPYNGNDCSNTPTRCTAWTTTTPYDRTTCNFGYGWLLFQNFSHPSLFSSTDGNTSMTPEKCKLMYAYDFPEDPPLTDAQAIKMWAICVLCSFYAATYSGLLSSQGFDAFLNPYGGDDSILSLSIRNLVLIPPAIKCFYFNSKPVETTSNYTYDFRLSTMGPAGVDSDNTNSNYYLAQIAVEEYLAGIQQQPSGSCGQMALPMQPWVMLDPFYWYNMSKNNPKSSPYLYMWFGGPATKDTSTGKTDTISSLSMIVSNPLFCVVDPNKYPVTSTASQSAGITETVVNYGSSNMVIVSQLNNPYWGQQAIGLIKAGNAVGSNQPTGYSIFPIGNEIASSLGKISYRTDTYNTCVYQCNNPNGQRGQNAVGVCEQACAGVGGIGPLGTITSPQTGHTTDTAEYCYDTATSTCMLRSQAQSPISPNYATQTLCESGSNLINTGGGTNCYVFDSTTSSCAGPYTLPAGQTCFTQPQCCSANPASSGCASATETNMIPFFIIIGVGLLILIIAQVLRYFHVFGLGKTK